MKNYMAEIKAGTYLVGLTLSKVRMTLSKVRMTMAKVKL
jgi:hypothetical protein